MKKGIRSISFLLVFILLLSSVSMAAAPEFDHTQESAYIINKSGSVVPTGNGYMTIQFSILGTGIMEMIGALHISLYKSNGTLVKSYDYWNYSSMMGYNDYVHYGTVSYHGVSGQSYYAVITFYARNSSGSGNRIYTTATVTA